jgi:hypothetical protein
MVKDNKPTYTKYGKSKFVRHHENGTGPCNAELDNVQWTDSVFVTIAGRKLCGWMKTFWNIVPDAVYFSVD